MKLGLQFEMQRRGLDDHKVIEETLEQCVLADQAGFDYLWFVEHHFLTGFSCSPCPELFYAAVSQRTKNIRLGLGVVILPYHHPIRVAERIAMLDHLSHGRVDLGTGRSSPYELMGMGIDPRDSREMWTESITMIPRIWTSEQFSYEGKFWKVPSRDVRPKPFQKPHPPLWVAALQNATYDIAADIGIGVLSFGSSIPSMLEPFVSAYKEKVKRARPVGAFINDQWCNSTLGVCLEDDRKAMEMGERSIKTFFGPGKPYVQDQRDVYHRLLQNWGGVPDHLKLEFSRYVGEKEELSREEALSLSGGDALSHKVWDELDAGTLCDRGVIIAGSPQRCIEGSMKHEAIGIDQMMVMAQTETVSHESVMETIELYGKHIIPEFKKRERAETKASYG
jgi:alkanesulfonate monooxygenase SsuD/methylene tetrahydromethanopterin reductase-like flavin-dependent oxidoreductase (luciferase family)